MIISRALWKEFQILEEQTINGHIPSPRRLIRLLASQAAAAAAATKNQQSEKH